MTHGFGLRKKPMQSLRELTTFDMHVCHSCMLYILAHTLVLAVLAHCLLRHACNEKGEAQPRTHLQNVSR